MKQLRFGSVRITLCATGVIVAALLGGGLATGCSHSGDDVSQTNGGAKVDISKADATLPQTLDQKIAAVEKDPNIPPPLKARMIAGMQKKAGH